jgi:hypothetical protein
MLTPDQKRPVYLEHEEVWPAVNLPPSPEPDGEGRFVMTPEIVTRLLADSGIYELLVTGEGTIAVEFRPGNDMVEEEANLLSWELTSSLLRRPEIGAQYSSGQTLDLYQQLLIDPDKHNPSKHIRSTDLVQLARNEILPVMIASAAGITGEEYARGEDGFDILCRSPGESTIERIQLKLIRSHSPLLHTEGATGRKKFLKLLSLLTAVDSRSTDRVLLVQDGSRNKALRALVDNLCMHGADIDRIRVLSEKRMQIFGTSLLNEARDDGGQTLLRIDLAKQSRALIANLLVNSLASLYPAGELRDPRFRIPKDIVEDPALTRILEAEGVFRIARQILRDQRYWS